MYHFASRNLNQKNLNPRSLVNFFVVHRCIKFTKKKFQWPLSLGKKSAKIRTLHFSLQYTHKVFSFQINPRNFK